MSRPHFPGLNGLRAVGALTVIPCHIEQLKPCFQIDQAKWFPVHGKIGVVLFFVLSGYLITFLLLHERRAVGESLHS